jgi:uncharacterized secreted protein with C-terminal beta-propeller domain
MKKAALVIQFALIAVAVSLLVQSVQAQSAQDCAALMKFGIYDKFRTFTTETHYLQIREFFENNTFSSKQQAQQKALDLGLAIDSVLNLRRLDFIE